MKFFLFIASVSCFRRLEREAVFGEKIGIKFQIRDRVAFSGVSCPDKEPVCDETEIFEIEKIDKNDVLMELTGLLTHRDFAGEDSNLEVYEYEDFEYQESRSKLGCPFCQAKK